MTHSPLKKSLLGLALLGISSSLSAQAAPVTLKSSFDVDTDVRVSIKYTGHTKHWDDTSAGAFNVIPANPPGAPFEAFCVSLGVSVGTGQQTLTANVISPLSDITNETYFKNSSFEDVGNRLAYILVKGASDSNPLADAAEALAVWYTIDKKFQYKGGSDDLRDLYENYISFAGYDEHTQYGGDSAKFYEMARGTDYQNLIGLDPPSVPEPAALVSATLGLAGVGLAALRRNRKAA